MNGVLGGTVCIVAENKMNEEIMGRQALSRKRCTIVYFFLNLIGKSYQNLSPVKTRNEPHIRLPEASNLDIFRNWYLPMEAPLLPELISHEAASTP
jgi:hypothetical protein